ncbi:MAG: tRNA adenosine(34) deaminase TadA [Terriglobia bacterium]
MSHPSLHQLEEHAKFMRVALRQARLAEKNDEVPVGAVVVHDGSIISMAHNRSIGLNDPTAHAEILALRRAGKKLGNYRLTACSLYVTIEPCAMCAGALVQARISQLVFGARDMKAGACGSALRVVNHPKLNHRVKVLRGVLAADSALLLREFFRRRR